MTTVDSFYRKECDKIPPSDIDAYIDVTIDPENPTGIILDNSWGTTKLDLEPIVKAGETVTHLMLDPEVDPIYLRYDNEAGNSECIYGNDLSRIISLTYLKDVDQATGPVNGDTYMYNEEDGFFYTYNLQTLINKVNGMDTNLQHQIDVINQNIQQLQNALTQLTNRVQTLEDALTPPANAPNNVKVAFGNINLISDSSNTSNKSWGLYTHDVNSTITNDEYFS